jgi:hypothetical protein
MGGLSRLGLVAACVLVVAGALLWWQQRTPAAFPHDFPYTWLVAGTITTDPEQVRVLPGVSPEESPQEDGKRLYPAYACTDPSCPGRVGGQALLFPFALQPVTGKAFAVCPACARSQLPETATMPGDPARMRPFLTTEGERIMRRFATATSASR